MSTEKPEVSRGNYLIKGGAVITVDPALGTFPTADVLVRNGAIAGVGPDLTAEGAEVIDASRMIVMPGLIDSHYHMWSTIGRNFLSDGGFEYYPAKWATAEHYGPKDFYNSVMLGLAELANGGITTVHNWSHNNRSAEHVNAELQAHRLLLRARYSIGHIDRLPVDVVNAFEDLDQSKANGSIIDLVWTAWCISASTCAAWYRATLVFFTLRCRTCCGGACRSVSMRARLTPILMTRRITKNAATWARAFCFATTLPRQTVIALRWLGLRRLSVSRRILSCGWPNVAMHVPRCSRRAPPASS